MTFTELKVFKGKLKLRVDFETVGVCVFKSFENEGEILRKFIYFHIFFSFYFSLALFTEVAILLFQQLHFEVVFQWIRQIFVVLHLNTNRWEVLLSFWLVFTLCASDVGRLFAVEYFLYEILFFWIFLENQVLYSIKQNVSEFINIHLNIQGCILSIFIFECYEKIVVDIGINLPVLQIKKYPFHLIDKILALHVNLLPLGFKYSLSEFGDVENLLQERVYIANWVGISQSDKADGSFQVSF